MFGKRKNVIKSRAAAAALAFVLAVCSMGEIAADMVSTVTNDKPSETSAPPDTVTSSPENVSGEAEEDTGEFADEPQLEEISEEKYLPLAGYEEIPVSKEEKKEEESENLLPKLATEKSAKRGGTRSTSIPWDTLTDTYRVAELTNTIKVFTAVYAADILDDHSDDEYPADTTSHLTRDEDFELKYTVSLNVDSEISPGNAVIRIKSTLFDQRNNQPFNIRSGDGTALPQYTIAPQAVEGENGKPKLYNILPDSVVKSNRTQFGYYIETDENTGDTYYVIVNYDTIKPGITWFEVVYDKAVVFDIPDGTTWEIEPEITVNRQYEAERYVFIGDRTGESTLEPIVTNWSQYLPDDAQTCTMARVNGEYCYAVEDEDYISYYTSDSWDQPKYRFDKNYFMLEQYIGDQWEEIDLDFAHFGELLGSGITTVANKCEDSSHNVYFRLDTAAESGAQAVGIQTYYDSNGDPVYETRTQDGTTTYYRAEDAGMGPVWVEDPTVSSELPTQIYEYKQSSEPSTGGNPTLTGEIHTEAKLDSVEKKVSAVTTKVTGNLNSEAQVLEKLPSSQQSALRGTIDLDNYIYVRWQVTVKGSDCTQPFELYLDEQPSYNSEQASIGSYLYFDPADGQLKSGSDSATVTTNGGEIIGVAGDPVVWSDDPPTIDGYTPTGSSQWLIGTSDPYDNAASYLKTGLDKIETTGRYEKTVYIVARYPRGSGIPSENSGDEGVCVDTLVEADDGDWVYIPHGAHIKGNSDHLYDLDAIFSAMNLSAEDVNLGKSSYDTTQSGNLIKRSIVKNYLGRKITDEIHSSQSADSPLIEDFIDILVVTLPQTDKLRDVMSSMTDAEKREFIFKCWQDPAAAAAQYNISYENVALYIQKACNDNVNTVLDEELGVITLYDSNGNQTGAQLVSYDRKKIYREVKNNAKVVIVPKDGIDPIEVKTDSAKHTREDKDPDVPGEYWIKKSAGGGKDGWIDIFDSEYDSVNKSLFRSTFSYTVNSSATSFMETHPKTSAYIYSNQSFVRLVTADDIMTAEPTGGENGQLYGCSYVLGPEDYCYTSAKIIVNERTYNIIDDTSAYGATELTDEAHINSSNISGAGFEVDRDWHIYVSYGTDQNGNTIWEDEYATISMDDYLAEDPSLYSNDTKGANVISLDFTNDEKLPYRIKVEHNTIDYRSTVKMELTAAVWNDSPRLCSPTAGNSDTIRDLIYDKDDENHTAVTSEDQSVSNFKIRLRNYAGLYAVRYDFTVDDNTGTATGLEGEKTLISDSAAVYDPLNKTSLGHIADADKLAGGVPCEAVTGDEAYATKIRRAYSDVLVSKLEKDSHAQKNSDYKNDRTNGRVNITYRIAGYEGYLLDSSFSSDEESIESLKNKYSTAIPGQSRQTIHIYDLMPPGVEYQGYSGTNDKPIAGFLTKNTDITKEANWITKNDNGEDLITVKTEIISEGSEEWEKWGGAQGGHGRYLVKFTLTFDPTEAEKYARADGGNWYFGCGVRFGANVSWERYTVAKATPNLAVYVTDSETIGKTGGQVYRDDGHHIPSGGEYEPFNNGEGNFDENDATPTSAYNRMYAKSQELGAIARASSTQIGKQVRANADTFALYDDRTSVVKGGEYTYNINVENQAGGAVSSIILYDVLDRAVEGDSYWKGDFRYVDVTMLELLGIYPVVWCYCSDPTVTNKRLTNLPNVSTAVSVSPTLPGESAWEAKGWVKYDTLTTDAQKAEVKVVAIELYSDSTHQTPYVMTGAMTLSYRICMKAPYDIDLSMKKYALNKPSYGYLKVLKDENDEWVVDRTVSYSSYPQDHGNTTVTTLGERRMLKIAKYVESRFSDTDEIQDTKFTLRLTRLIGHFENGTVTETDEECANFRYRVYPCTFRSFDNQNEDDNRFVVDTIQDGASDEIDSGVIHTTNENGEFVLHDGECAVFEYVSSTPTNSQLQSEYDFENYKVTELSKPFWYGFKCVDTSYGSSFYYTGRGLNNNTPVTPTPTDEEIYGPSATPGVTYYRQSSVTITNTYRPVIYISKDTSSVPDDLPTDETKSDAFNTFDYKLTLFEYPINRLTGEYFGDDEGYSAAVDASQTGEDKNDGKIIVGGAEKKAAWLKFKEYYEDLPSVISSVGTKITALETLIANTNGETDPAALSALNDEKAAWENFKKALENDKALFDAHKAKAESDGKTFFSQTLEDIEGVWTGADTSYLLRTKSNKLVLPITGYSDSPQDLTYKSFSNSVSLNDDRVDGDVLYTYTVNNHTDIYDTPDGWVPWESSGQENRRHYEVSANPATIQIKSGETVAVPLYLSGGMMYSDFGITIPDGGSEPAYSGRERYISRYCYSIKEDMDTKYWDDKDGEYKTVPNISGTSEPNTDERAWLVNTPEDNFPYRYTLGLLGENILEYDNNYRFKDIYVEKTVEPSKFVPKGDRKNSVDTTVYIYKVMRRTQNGSFETPPQSIIDKMSWELWTRDDNGRLLKKLMVGPVTSEGFVTAPIANYDDAESKYTVKIRYAEVGYTYEIEELLTPEEIFGSASQGTAAQKKAALESRIPYIEYSAQDNTLTFKSASAYDSSHICYAPGNALEGGGTVIDTAQAYTLATEELYATPGSSIAGSLKTHDTDPIRDSMAKVDMSIENVYKLRNLTVTKSIIAKTIDPDMKFTVRVRRNGKTFTPSYINFYRMDGGERRDLTPAEVAELQQGVNYTVVRHMAQTANDSEYYYIDFNLQNGVYAELVDVGEVTEEFMIAEKDWDPDECDYVHLDPIDGPGEWSQWKTVRLVDNTISTVRNGTEGYMIISKEYFGQSSGNYDAFASQYLKDNKISIAFRVRANSGGDYFSPQNIPDELATVNGVSVNDLSDIELAASDNIILDLKGLCEYLHDNGHPEITYDNIEYVVSETIPNNVAHFRDEDEDVIYSVEPRSDSAFEGTKDNTAVEIQNVVTKYETVIYKRLGGIGTLKDYMPTGQLHLRLIDGSSNGQQAGVKYIVTGDEFDAEKPESDPNAVWPEDDHTGSFSEGVTDEEGNFYIETHNGWSWMNTTDGNQMYYAKIYFSHRVLCNKNLKNDPQELEIVEDLLDTDPSWGYLIGYENYGQEDTYVSHESLEQMNQWLRRANTIVNTKETMTDDTEGSPRVEVKKVVKPSEENGSLTEQDVNQTFTFTVKQFVNGVYEDAPDINYWKVGADGNVLTDGSGDPITFRTDSNGAFELKHNETAKLNLPLFSYWEITETGAGEYRLLVNDSGEIVYDANGDGILTPGVDGLAPDAVATSDVYETTQTASGFRLHTSMDIVTGIPNGTPVVLRSGRWKNDNDFYNFVFYDEGEDDPSYFTTTQAAKYYYGTNSNLYAPDNSSLKVDKNVVTNGVICTDLMMENPVWYDKSTVTDNAVKTAVANYWTGDVTVPQYIFFVHADGKTYRHKVVGIGKNAFNGASALTSVTIPKSVQKIGYQAFLGCSNLASCTFEQDSATKQSDLVSIGEKAFYNLAIKYILLPEGLIQLGKNAFYKNYSKDDRLANTIYLPTTLADCSVQSLPSFNGGQQGKEAGNWGLLEINSGMDNAEGVLGGTGSSVTLFRNFFRPNTNDTTPYGKGASNYRPHVLIFNNLNRIRSKVLTDRGDLLRNSFIWVFPEDTGENNFIMENSSVVRTSFELADTNYLFIWRSSVIGDSNNNGVIFEHNVQAGSFTDYGLRSTKNKSFTLVLTNINSTDDAQIQMLASRFDIHFDSINQGWYYEGNYGTNKKINPSHNQDSKVTVIFADQLPYLRASDILNAAGVADYDAEVNGRVTEILVEAGARSGTTPSGGQPPVHTSGSAVMYLTSALWVYRKRDYSTPA